MTRCLKYLVGLLMTMGFACSSNDDVDNHSQYREDVAVCNEAVAHITDCCQFEAPSDACAYHYTDTSCGCGSSQQGSDPQVIESPVLTINASNGYLALSCEELESVGCDALRAQVSAPHTQYTGDSDCE